jgi:DNA-binding winged helix-turn-helix (wHTH) protein
MTPVSGPDDCRCCTVNLIAPETFRSVRLAARARRDGGIALRCSAEPLPPGETALYLISSTAMELLLCNHERYGHLPVIAFGPARHLPRAFALGCADYLREPWSYDELKTRSLRLLPHPALIGPHGEVRLTAGMLSGSAEQVDLTDPECRLLCLLLTNAGGPVYREALELAVWGHRRASTRTRSLDMHISLLRKKIRRAGGMDPALNPIEAVRGIGYRLALSCARQDSRFRDKAALGNCIEAWIRDPQ